MKEKFKGMGFYNIQAMFEDGGAIVQFVDPDTLQGSPPFSITKSKLAKLREIADVRN